VETINEKIVPVLANKKGVPGVAMKDTETGQVIDWKSAEDIKNDPELKSVIDPYYSDKGYKGYKIDPDRFQQDLAKQRQQQQQQQRQQNLQVGSRKPGQSTAEFHAQLRQQLDKDFPTTRRDGTRDGDATTGREVRQPPKPAPKPTLDPKLKADLDKFAPKINQDWAAANQRLARVELARAQQRAAGKSVFDKQFRQTKVNPIMYKHPSVEEAYDVVLDYLLSEGHADTVEEAHYVMMQLDSEFIQDIVEGVKVRLPGEPGETPSSGYKEPVMPGEQRLTPNMKKLAPVKKPLLPPA
jgi:hypothetical protein